MKVAMAFKPRIESERQFIALKELTRPSATLSHRMGEGRGEGEAKLGHYQECLPGVFASLRLCVERIKTILIAALNPFSALLSELRVEPGLYSPNSGSLPVVFCTTFEGGP